MRAFFPTPRKQQEHLREAPRPQRQTCREAVRQMIEGNIPAPERYFPLVYHKSKPERPLPDGVLEAASEQEHIRRSETKVLVTAYRLVAVDVGAA